MVYYAAKKGFWIYIGTNGRLLRPDVADRLGDAGASVFNFCRRFLGREAEPAEGRRTRAQAPGAPAEEAVRVPLHGFF